MNAPPPELWVFRGTQPVIWRIPVKVTVRKPDELSGKALLRSSVRAHFMPAIHLLDCQHRALDNFFASQKIIELSPAGNWRLKMGFQSYHRRLEKMGGVRATGNDPEEYLMWGAKRPPMTGLDKDHVERRAWLEEMVARGGGESVEQLAYQWRAFCLHIAHTLVNKEQPVDFYWFKLHNCPLRTGWQAVLSYRKMAATHPKTVLRAILGRANLLAYDVEGGHCLRHIEIEHTRDWWKLVRRAERARLAHLQWRSPEYAKKYQKSIERFALAGWRLYCCWREEMAQAGVVRVPHRRGGSFRFMPGSLERQMYRKIHRTRQTVTKANIHHLRSAIAIVTPTLSRPNGSLSKMPHLRQAAEAVRQPADEGSRPAVDQPRDGSGGSDGLLVPTQSQKLVPSGEMLASRTGIDGQGVASGT